MGLPSAWDGHAGGRARAAVVASAAAAAAALVVLGGGGACGAGFFLVGVLPYGGGCQNVWVGGCPAPPPPRRAGHCGGCWVSAEGAGQGIVPAVVGWVGVQ